MKLIFVESLGAKDKESVGTCRESPGTVRESVGTVRESGDCGLVTSAGSVTETGSVTAERVFAARLSLGTRTVSGDVFMVSGNWNRGGAYSMTSSHGAGRP